MKMGLGCLFLFVAFTLGAQWIVDTDCGKFCSTDVVEVLEKIYISDSNNPRLGSFGR
jgi:hypothetical protein